MRLEVAGDISRPICQLGNTEVSISCLAARRVTNPRFLYDLRFRETPRRWAALSVDAMAQCIGKAPKYGLILSLFCAEERLHALSGLSSSNRNRFSCLRRAEIFRNSRYLRGAGFLSLCVGGS